MATDKLIFPIGFDLEKAVADAEGQADKLLRRLETTIKSRPLAINLKIGNAGSGSLNEINARMRDIVKEWNNLTEAERVASKTSGEYTDRAKKLIAEFIRLTGATESYARSLQQITAAARKAANEQERNLEKQRKTEAILKAQENTIANITAKLQHWKKEMNSADMGSRQFHKAAEEVKRLSHSLTEAQRSVNALTGNFRKQDGYVSRLIKRLAVYAGYQQFSNFLTSVREVTAEFELQRISLGAIIQDQAKANQLFSEIKNFALKSPVKILDLTKYTKQLAAYKFETEKLFDWTKRLTDISVGLGVSMDRIILLAGQIRATGYLRGSEVRQATEAGIPLVEELAQKLEELNGRAYTTAEVMNMISERAISWEMVADVFKDMTSAGGMFFDIQEKQGNTLYGMWQKLGDAASVMYEEIGNTDSVNAGMKNTISTLRTLMLNWKLTGAALGTVGVAVLLYINRIKLAEKWIELSIIAESKSVIALKSKQAALTRLISIQRASTGAVKADTVATKLWTAVKIRGVQALNLMTAAVKGLTAALAKNIWGIAILGLTLLIEKLWLTEDATEKLKNKLSDIQLDYEVKQGQDASNFEYLANAAVEAAKGSKAQKDALEELKNTYGKIIPLELLTIENLERMKGNYGELIALIDEYNLKQKYEAEKSAIEESFAPEQEKRAGIIREELRDGLRLDYADEKTGGVFDKVLDLSERNIQRFLLNLNKYADEGKDKFQQIGLASQDLAKELGLNKEETEALVQAMVNLDRAELEGQGTLVDYTEGLQRKHEALSVVNDDYDNAKQKLNEYSSIVDEVMKKNEDEPEVTTYNNALENEKARLNNQIGDVANGIVELFNKANVEVDNGTKQLLQTVITNGGMIPTTVWDLLEKTAENVNNPKLLAAIQSLWNHYQKLAPDNETVNFVRNGFIEIVNAAKGNMKEYRQYLYDGSVTIKEYQGNLQTSIQQLKAQAFEMVRVNALIDAGLAKGQKYDEATIKALQGKADVLQTILDQYVTPLVLPDDKKSSRSGGIRSDNRLSQLREIEQTLTTINSKYEELLKKEGQTKALADIQKIYGDTLAYINKLGGKFKLNFAMPTEFKTLQEYRKAIQGVIEKLKMKGYEKAALELQTKIDTGDVDKLGKEVETKIKQLADRISRTKTAREFYDKVMGMTGDYELAGKVALSIYGSNGDDLKQQLAKQIRELTNDLELPDGIISADNIVDYKALREWAELNKGELGETYDELVKIAEQGQKDLAKTYEGYLKDLEKAKTYASQRIELAQTTAAKIRQIRADMASGQTDKAVGENLISGLIDKEMKEAAKLEWEAFKGTPLYTQMFEDLEHASTSTLEMMRSRLEALSHTWGSALDPTQLKETQSRMNEITEQLRERNPWKQLKEAYRQYKDATDSVTFTGAASKAGAASKNYYDTSVAYGADSVQAKAALQELQAREKIVGIVKQITEEQGKQVKGQKALTLAQQKAFDNEKIARGHLEIAAAELKKAEDKATAEGKDPANDPEVKAKREALKLAEEQLDIAERTSSLLVQDGKSIAKWRKSIASAGQGIAQGLQIGADLAKGIADTMEALGGNEDDVQYWNDISTAIGDITAGVQGLIDSVLSLNVGGIISNAIGIIPNMVKGFAGLFSAGKVRKANKEIKRQQEILERLEYTYSRLEKASDKLFGINYINNYNQRIKNLEAQATAYQRQAAAERSKGKKADKAKIKEYENAYRDTMDEIADMEAELTAKFVGASRTDLARDFAQSWLEAKASFASTTDAMASKYKDMIQSMIVEGAAAKIIDNILAPMWDNMNALLEKGDTVGGIDYLVNSMDAFVQQADNGMNVLWESLKARGYDMKKLLGDTGGNEYTGIKRDIASASEESINGLAAGINTQNYYIAKQLAEVQRIRGLLEVGVTPIVAGGSSSDAIALQNQAMGHLAAININTSETLRYCKAIAENCDSQLSVMRRVLVVRGSQPTIAVSLKN